MSDTSQAHDRTVLLLEEATQAEGGSLAADLVLGELEGWDSMGMVMFIGLVQEHLGVELSVHDLRESRTVSDLVGRVECHRKGGPCS